MKPKRPRFPAIPHPVPFRVTLCVTDHPLNPDVYSILLQVRTVSRTIFKLVKMVIGGGLAGS